MTVGIYSIVLKDSLVYVGKSDNIESRKASHVNALDRGVHSNYKLQRAYDEFKDSFKFNILQECADKDLLVLERFWIDEFNAEVDGLNLPYRGNIDLKGFKARGQEEPILIGPSGEELQIESLSDFCKLFNLDMGAMHHVINKKRSHHKGWKLKT